LGSVSTTLWGTLGFLPQFTGIVEADETYVGGKYDKRKQW